MKLRSVSVAALAAVACALVPASAADAATKKRCAIPRGADVVAKTSEVVVFTVDRSSGDLTQTLFGCYRKTAKRVRLADASDDEFVTSVEFDQVTVSGRFVAWQWTSTDQSCKADCPPDYEPTTYSIERADLKTRKTLQWTDARAETGTLQLSQAGNAAWVQSSGTPGVFAVRVGNRNGHKAIDTGAIDPKSLLLEGDVLLWINGDQARTARLR